jgi:hypothetical protein
MPFSGNQLTVKHQHNAIQSWCLLSPRPEIILFGNDDGVDKAAKQYNVRHSPQIRKNALGDLSMRSIFRQIDEHSTADWICYIHTDVILLDDFIPNFEYLVSQFEIFVSCAGRLDANIPEIIDFAKEDWQKKVLAAVYKLGRKGSDYCIYPRGFYHNMPDYSIGKGHWDGWRMGLPLEKGVPLVNIERSCKAVHQKHGHRFSGHPGSKRKKGLSKGRIAWIMDATHYVERKDVFNA